MGSCFSKKEVIFDYNPLISNRESEIESLQNYINTLQSQLKFYTSSKNEIYDRYFHLIEREKMLSNENKKLKNLLDSHKILYNNTH